MFGARDGWAAVLARLGREGGLGVLRPLPPRRRARRSLRSPGAQHTNPLMQDFHSIRHRETRPLPLVAPVCLFSCLSHPPHPPAQRPQMCMRFCTLLGPPRPGKGGGLTAQDLLDYRNNKTECARNAPPGQTGAGRQGGPLGKGRSFSHWYSPSSLRRKISFTCVCRSGMLACNRLFSEPFACGAP